MEKYFKILLPLNSKLVIKHHPSDEKGWLNALKISSVEDDAEIV